LRLVLKRHLSILGLSTFLPNSVTSCEQCVASLLHRQPETFISGLSIVSVLLAKKFSVLLELLEQIVDRGLAQLHRAPK
jgi:hypothetical protein